MNKDLLSRLFQSFILGGKHNRQESLDFIAKSKDNYNKQLNVLSEIGNSIEKAMSHEELEKEKIEIIDGYYTKWKELDGYIKTIDNAIKNATDLLLIDYNSLYPNYEKKYKSMDAIGFEDLCFINSVPVFTQENVYHVISLFSLLVELAMQATKIQGEIDAVIDSPYKKQPSGFVDYARFERIIKRENAPLKRMLSEKHGRLSQTECADCIISAKDYYRNMKLDELSGTMLAESIQKTPDVESVVRTIQRWDQYLNSKKTDKKGTKPPEGYSRYQGINDFQKWAFKREAEKYKKWKNRLHAFLKKEARNDNMEDKLENTEDEDEI